ncbi:hypothetical protein GKD46_21345, partial [Parabacteroides distasonis]|nr:hypothetical protein [Parabacteroides distasonis]
MNTIMNKNSQIFAASFVGTAMVASMFAAPVLAVDATQSQKVNFPSISFEDGEDVADYESYEVDTSIVSTDATDGSKALKATYKPVDWPGIHLLPKSGQVWDLGEGNALSLDIKNESDKAVDLYVKIYDGSDDADSTIFKGNIKANESNSFYTSLAQGNDSELGMHQNPPSGKGINASYAWGKKDLNLSNVTRIDIWLMYNKEPVTLVFDNIRSIPDPSSDKSYLNNIIDTYGQYTKETWDGKITNDQQLLDNKAAEQLELQAGLETRNNAPLTQYGGWKNEAFKQEATGHFYPKKIHGKWSLVDPEGYPYIATGLDIIRLDDMLTWVSGRDYMFENIPDRTKFEDSYTDNISGLRPPAGLETGTGINFYKANLQRKYGDDYLEDWKQTTLDRFKSWGFTSLGCWSDPNMFFGKGEENKISYVANGWINGNHQKISSGGSWGAVADPFDPEFKVSAENMAQSVASKGVNEDPWCLGIYVDNEISWGNSGNPDQYYAINKETYKL